MNDYQNKTQSPAFDKAEWAAKKKAEREEVFSLIDETAVSLANDPQLFRNFLDVQSRFDRYSVSNSLLITAQRPDMTEAADAKAWNDKGVYVKKGETGTLILVPGEEYTKADGSTAVSFNVKRVFDISQTTAMPVNRPSVQYDDRLLFRALFNDAPCNIKSVEPRDMPVSNVFARYRAEDDTLYVCKGLDTPTLFRAAVNELAHAYMKSTPETYQENGFTAHCVTYVMCQRFHIPNRDFNFDRMPESFKELDAKAIRAELSQVRDVSNSICSGMSPVLEGNNRADKQRSDEAR